MAIEKILVIDDELAFRKSLQEQLINNAYSVSTADTIASADHSLANDVFDLVFMDVRLPDGDGTDLLRTFSKKQNAPLIVMMTGYASVESAVTCMRAGAFDYIIKPFYSSQIDIIVKKAEEYSHILSLNRFYN
jgi:DNA-binding NtrC family response regulator